MGAFWIRPSRVSGVENWRRSCQPCIGENATTVRNANDMEYAIAA